MAPGVNYPGPGQGIEVGGSYGPVAPVAWNDSATGHAWTGSAANGANYVGLMFNVPKLPAGDVWTQGYLTFFLSSDTTKTNINLSAWWQYYTGATVTDTHFGGSNVDPVSTISLTGGAALPPVQVGTFYPYLVFPPTQGIAKPYFIDLSLFNDSVDFLQSAIASANNYNTNGLLGPAHASFSGFNSDINLIIATTPANGGSATGSQTVTIYNPVLTMFSLHKYAWVPPVSGGDSKARFLMAGVFGRQRRV